MRKGIGESGLTFEPNIKILLRIMQLLRENNSIGRTALALESNINYTILSRYINWLENRSIIKLVLVGSKANICMTEKGRDFATELNNFSLQFASLIDKISI